MKNSEKVAELIKGVLVGDWQKAVVSGFLNANSNGLRVPLYIAVKMADGSIASNLHKDYDEEQLARAIVTTAEVKGPYQFTLVLLSNGEVTVDEGSCAFGADGDITSDWESKYLH